MLDNRPKEERRVHVHVSDHQLCSSLCWLIRSRSFYPALYLCEKTSFCFKRLPVRSSISGAASHQKYTGILKISSFICPRVFNLGVVWIRMTNLPDCRSGGFQTGAAEETRWLPGHVCSCCLHASLCSLFSSYCPRLTGWCNSQQDYSFTSLLFLLSSYSSSSVTSFSSSIPLSSFSSLDPILHLYFCLLSPFSLLNNTLSSFTHYILSFLSFTFASFTFLISFLLRYFLDCFIFTFTLIPLFYFHEMTL